jgi:hypothetical protein
MKKFVLFFFLIVILESSSICYGQTIQTGNASAKSTVINNVSGSGNVYTKIEVTANGEKKTLETTEQGTHSLEVNSNKNNIKASSSAENKPSLKETIAKNRETAKIQKIKQVSLLDNLKNLIINLLKNLSF